MSRIEESVAINRAARQVFAYVAESSNLLEVSSVLPCPTEVTAPNTGLSPAGGGRRHAGERERRVLDCTRTSAGKLSLPIVYRMNEREGETVLANLKARMEA